MRLLKYVIIVLVGLLVGVVAAQLTRQYNFPTTGDVANITVTFSQNGTEVTTLDWGICDNGSAYVMEPLTVTNTGNLPVTLTLAAVNPSSNVTSIMLTWNYTGTIIVPEAYTVVELTQTVSALGPYTYETVITATEA